MSKNHSSASGVSDNIEWSLHHIELKNLFWDAVGLAAGTIFAIGVISLVL